MRIIIEQDLGLVTHCLRVPHHIFLQYMHQKYNTFQLPDSYSVLFFSLIILLKWGEGELISRGQTANFIAGQIAGK